MRLYVVLARTAPDRRIVNKEYCYSDEATAWVHLNRLKKLGWKCGMELRVT